MNENADSKGSLDADEAEGALEADLDQLLSLTDDDRIGLILASLTRKLAVQGYLVLARPLQPNDPPERGRNRGMPSAALIKWEGDAQRALDEIEAAHRAVEGSGRGRRYATLQINHAYAVLISSQFQGFCRGLHSEAVAFIVNHTSPASVSDALHLMMSQGRKLDFGNPNPGNVSSDFARFDMDFWSAVKALDARNQRRQDALQDLNEWRNSIAHQDWAKVGGSPTLRLRTVRVWRSTCRALARSFDRAVRAHLTTMVGRSPW